MSEPLLAIEGLTLAVEGDNALRRILDGVTLELYPNRVTGLVGESGSGKTMTALASMGLLPSAVKILAGRILFEGQDLLAVGERELRKVRGARIAMIFQSPRAALNPLMRVGDQVARAVRLHSELQDGPAYDRAVELLRHVGISGAAIRARAYPHQLSGGMMQRVLVAMMLACQPKLLIADEPTTGLDVTIQAQIFELIKDVQAETGAALLLITHDLGVVSEVCQSVYVMYAGQIMESAPVAELFARPRHPYTQRLMGSILRVDRPSELDTSQALLPIRVQYDVPGCRFANRCPYVHAPCMDRPPERLVVSPGHTVFCYKVLEETQ
jgi:oligopeptide/dipeptide ABC transporter ATP-binding protein